MAEKLWQTLEQLYLARRLFRRGDVPSLRMALVLVDNAAEILLYREVKLLLDNNRFIEHLSQDARSRLTDHEYNNWCAEVGYHPISDDERKELKGFKPKTNFLGRIGKLKPKVARFLNVFHEARNAAFHQDEVREATLASIVTVGFDVVVAMLSTFQGREPILVRGRADRGIARRFGPSWSGKRGIALIQRTLRSRSGLSQRMLNQHLRRDLEDRIVELERCVDIVRGSLGTWERKEEKRLQYWCAKTADRWIVATQSAISRLQENNSLDLYLAYAAIDSRIKRYEDVLGMADTVISFQEAAFDVWRGK
mgnify:CR=1 FL=1|jgi:hypothetical protein